MHIQRLKLICFSPTGTTRSIVTSIAKGVGIPDTEFIDITLPEGRTKILQTSEHDLLIIAVPVYVGRVPPLINGWLHSIKATGTPVACVVVYGNREYEDALLELKDIVKESEGIPFAGAAFIGEHSFCSENTPIAPERPDAADLQQAEIFGRMISEKLQAVSSISQCGEIDVPGKYPYREWKNMPDEIFIEVDSSCLQCEVCAEVCPAGAIESAQNNLPDMSKCILCCACIKNCPEHARTMKPGAIMDVAMRLNQNCQARKEPSVFL